MFSGTRHSGISGHLRESSFQNFKLAGVAMQLCRFAAETKHFGRALFCFHIKEEKIVLRN
jgi:hypothetical protein